MRDDKLSMFIHWGVYSAPVQGEWHMFGSNTKPAAYRAQYAASFATRSQSFDPDAWARLARDLRAGEVVLTVSHHDGFALWPAATPTPGPPPHPSPPVPTSSRPT
ncbi:alpha-L-fucosidase [Kitasatospora sp. NPDC051914]|uniref:alpha-L-fucosidase n=1 Tax=Kitasatospora sp. NPDC051914 TaxID=3154945 RepID=UPI00341DC3F8